jgi:1-phosphofructokinase family hexose kinase
VIRVVGADPAMDRVSTWGPIRMGQVNRAVEVSVLSGGKGLNVARANVRLGCETTAYGFLGGQVEEALREMILVDGIADRHTAVAAGTRACFIVVEPDPGRSTVLNEPGPAVTDTEVDHFLDDLRRDCESGDVVLLSGSLPDSVDPAVAGEIVAIGKDAGCRTIVDIHSESLRHAANRQPWMIKCNREELLGLVADGVAAQAAIERHQTLSLPALAAEMQQVRERGIEVVVVTLGGDGVLLADADGVVHVGVPQIEVINATGSGDLLLAGLAVGIERGQPPREAILVGAACGTAGATHLAPELPPGFVAAAWIGRLTIEPVEPIS